MKNLCSLTSVLVVRSPDLSLGGANTAKNVPKEFTSVSVDEKTRLYKPKTYTNHNTEPYKYKPPPKVSSEPYKIKHYEPNDFNHNKIRNVGKPREYDHVYDIFPPKKEKKKEEPPAVKTPTPEPARENTPPARSPTPIPYNPLPSIQRTMDTLFVNNKVKPVDMITDSFG